MAIEIRLPKLGLTMEEGTVDEWLVADGTDITVGMPLLRLATDKIDVDVEAEADGILARAVPDGTTLPPGAVLGWLLAAGEDAPAGIDARRGAPPRLPRRSSSSRPCRARTTSRSPRPTAACSSPRTPVASPPSSAST